MLLPSGGDLLHALRTLPEGEVLELMPGGTYAGGEVEGRKRLEIEGHGALVTGGIKFSDCETLAITDLLLPDAPHHALMIVGCHKLDMRRVYTLRAAVNGILTSNVYHAHLVDCQAKDSKTGHGLYFSERGGDYRVEGGVYTGNARCNIQVNAHPFRATDLAIVGADCRNPGNASIQCAAVTRGELAANLVGGGRQEIVLWDDTGKKKFGCVDFDCTKQPGQYVISKWCRKIRLPEGATFTRPE
jgi:hypothetical protein